MEKVIETVEVEKYYGKFRALCGVSFEVERGTITAFLGPNGAGKTTTIHILCGVLLPTRGRVSVLGMDPSEVPEKVKERLGIVPEEPALLGELTPLEHMRFVGELRGMERRKVEERIEFLADLLSLRKDLNKPTYELSKGNKRKVCMAIALLHEPELLILDEPFTGIDPVVVHRLKEYLVQYARSGNTVFFSSHVLDVVENLADRYIIIHKGYIKAEGEISGLGRGELEELFLKEVSQ